jgi:hypothetical protein
MKLIIVVGYFVMPESSSFHREPAATCGNCHAELKIPEDVVRKYFRGERAVCLCGATQDWWSLLLAMINSVMVIPLRVIGAHITVLTLELRQGQESEIDFTAAGVPDDAQILRVYYTAQGDGLKPPLFPLQILLSHPEPPWIPRKFSIYPHMPSPDAAEASKLAVLAAWVPAAETDTPRTQLIAAFNAYSRGDYSPPDYNQCIIPANVAVEIALGGLMASWLNQVASSKRVKDFLNNQATYSHQLNVLLPAMVHLTGGTQLPGQIRGSLNKLRDLRNEIGHGGVPKAPITKATAAECLCAAIFGVEYMRMIKEAETA